MEFPYKGPLNGQDTGVAEKYDDVRLFEILPQTQLNAVDKHCLRLPRRRWQRPRRRLKVTSMLLLFAKAVSTKMLLAPVPQLLIKRKS